MPRRRKDLLRLLEQATAQRTPVLDLSNCNLEGLLDEVLRMDWLVELNLSHCHINALPGTIGNLTGLTRLALAENQLTTLPDSITRLTALQRLDLTNAGSGLSVPADVMGWLKTLPEALWTDGKPPGHEPPVPPLPPLPFPDHPNALLERLKSALTLYTDALSMEDRGFGGSGKRAEADAFIQRLFQTPGLEDALPEFHQDFEAHRFYSTSCESEKMLDQNPFRLPTKADDDWLAANQPPLRLEAFVEGGRHILTINRQTGVKTEVTVCQHGGITQCNAPYEQDERFWADCAAWLYQAGSERFYVRVETHGLGEVPGDRWLGSDDGGASWQEQAKLTYAWLSKTRGNWRELDHLAPTRS